MNKENTEEKLWVYCLMSLTVIMIFLIGLLFIMLISVVYIAGYVYDSIFGNSFIRLGHFISGKYPKIKNISIVEKLWRKIQPKELYLRYETPLFTYCFSYTANSLLALVLPNENGMGIIVASALYLLFYFVGMARKYGRNEQYYEKILDNNIEFLKLSFLFSVINYFRKHKVGYIGLSKKFLGIVAYFLKNI